jgi:FtsP/CotA-like multicopper oxidase with cupredoxin domain
MPKKKAKHRPGVGKKTEGTISRRSVLKIGAAAGAAGVLAPSMLTSREALGFQTIAEPEVCTTPVSPNHHPFVDEFTAPFPGDDHPLNPQPTEAPNLGAGEADRAPHQRFTQFTPAHFTYEMEARAGLHTFHSDFSPTYIWGFNGVYPASTLLQRYGKPTVVRFRNSLPLNTTTLGVNEITIHLHNGHHGSESDGFAGDWFTPPFWKDNLYPNCYAGLDAFGGNGDAREKMGSFWFHDHRAEHTLVNNILGLNGMFIVYDKTDPGHEYPSQGSLQLPGYYGITDFPLILTDKRFCATANGRTEMIVTAGGTDKWIVNGKIQPKMTVRRRKYRFRILNTGPTKTWNLTLIGPDASNNAKVQTMTVIATDANFLEKPIPVDDSPDNAKNSNADTAPIVPGGLRVSVAERYDVIIDFGKYAAGTKLYLKENGTPNGQKVGFPSPDPLPTGLLIQDVVMQFNVVNREPWFPADTPAIPDQLCTYPDLPEPDNKFEWQFVLVGGRFRVKRPGDAIGCVFDPEHPAHCILRGTTEEWLLRNDIASGWTHPIHIHFEEFRTFGRFTNGVLNDPPVPPLMSGRKDVSRLEPGQATLLRMQFRDYNGRYLIHCHNMAHEDNFMMVRWDICPDQSSLDACIADQQICQRELEAKERFREEVA